MSADRKITEYTPFTLTPKGADIFLAVRDTQGIPTTGTFTYTGLFANVSVPVVFSNTVVAHSVTTANLIISSSFTPQSSLTAIPKGAILVDDDYIYVSVGSKLKRARLEDF